MVDDNFSDYTVESDITSIAPEEFTSGEGSSGVEPQLPVTSDPDDPVFPPADPEEPVQTFGDIVIITPAGPIVLYAESGTDEYNDLVSAAEAAWVDKYGAMDKPLHNYSVSEALLFIIACGTVVSLLCKLFKRRKM